MTEYNITNQNENVKRNLNYFHYLKLRHSVKELQTKQN